ncbi:isoprenyl transferase [bacterium]|nr:isoprenyl transferase [bacterium]
MTFTSVAELPPERCPRHIAIIMDGNGRWAKERGRGRLFGHRHGIDSVRETVRECHRAGIGYLTLYAFSLENWKRPVTEIAGLWRLLKSYVERELPELKENGVRLNVIGRVERIPRDVRAAIEYTIRETASGQGMVLTIALSYGGRDEIVEAARRLAARAKAGAIEPGAIDEAGFARELMTADMPDPDLLIRTSGEMRVSNYLLWQIAYAEIHVTDVLWPDFRREHLHRAILDYAARERRFGATSDQLASGTR